MPVHRVFFLLGIAAVFAGCDDDSADRSAPDVGISDFDAQAPDEGQVDAGAPDSGAPDSGAPDSGAPDGDAGESLGRLEVRQGNNLLVRGGEVRFGRILTESAGATFELRLVNAGAGPLFIEAPTVTGANAPEFTLGGASPLELAPTSSSALSVTFRPTASSTRSATLRIRSDDPNAPTFDVALEGVGVALEQLPADTNGDWGAPEYIAYDTREARIVVRVGDIDNLGFGWPAGFDPFLGQSTPPHRFPWTPDPGDPAGTDRIMVVSSYSGSPPAGQDGYTTSTSRPENLPEPVTLNFDLRGSRPSSAVLQMFVDDFQAPVWGASYQVRLDGQRAPFIEDVLATLVQTGPVGKLITLPMPSEQLSLLDDGRLEIEIDDPTTGAGDGFAIDFVKLFIDVYGFTNVGTIEGVVTDATGGLGLEGVAVSASGIVSAVSDAAGAFRLQNVPAGFVYLRALRSGYAPFEILLDLRTGQTVTQNVSLTPQ